MSTENVETDYLWGRRHNLMMRAITNRLYQQERHRHMEWREGFVKVGSLVLGSVVFANVLDAACMKWAAALVFALSASSLVFGWGNKARDSSKRSSEWAGVEREIEAAGPRGFTEDQLNAWAERCSEIEANEPAPNERMLAACRRRACEVLGDEEVPPRKRLWWVPHILIP